MATRRVVVTGMGALTPIGLSVEQFWQGMMQGKSGAAPITYFDTTLFETKFACELKGFDPSMYLDRKEARRLDKYSQYGISASVMALADAGIVPAELTEEEKDRIGVIVGSGIGGLQTFEDQVVTMEKDGPRRISPFFIPMMIADICAGLISIRFGFRGPNYAAVSACSTANHNIMDAMNAIQRDMADIMVTGGAEAAVTRTGVGGFNAAKALSTNNDEAETASRPFDKRRDGFVLGEGAGILILEELEHAKARGAKIYAEILGIGMSADAYHMTAPDPNGRGAALSMKMALRDAGLNLDQVDYLNMHGTSTPLGDLAETKAIKQVFGDHAYKMNVSSTKSMTGHLLGAAGAAEAIAAILTIQNNVIPPTINFVEADPECDLNYTFNTPQERPVNVAASNVFGFGGHNTTVLFGRFNG
ncbi:MAG TPA: beta-ketoacyl-ACP synthase II [Rhodothermales bacterium]|nr:beta-ketoacyl-ACP synthase II [Rhodothermales bacterium]